MATGGQKRANYLRANLTATELSLWQTLRRIEDPRFRRQKAFGPYVLDFYAPRFKLCIELDGPFHDGQKDKIRDAWLLERGVFTLRIKVEGFNPQVVVKQIEEACLWLKPSFRLRNGK